MLKKFIWMCLLGAEVFFGCTLSNSTIARADQLLPTESFTLGNGLKVILYEDHSKPFVAINVQYRTGVVTELIGESGMTLMIDILMNRWSEHIGTSSPYYEYLKSGATQVHSGYNSQISSYSAVLPSLNLETALWLESDRMAFLLPTAWAQSQSGAYYAESAKESAIDVLIRGERSLEYYAATQDRWQSLFGSEHPYYYAMRGESAQIQAISLSDITRHYRAYYSPNNASLALVGDLDIEKTKKLIMKYFGTLERRSISATRTVPTPGLEKETTHNIAEHIATTPAIWISWLTPELGTKEDTIADILALVLDRGQTGRMHLAFEFDKNILSFRARQYSHEKSSLFLIKISIANSQYFAKALSKIDDLLTEIIENGITETELRNIQSRQRLNILNSIQTIAGKASFLQQTHGLNSNSIYLKEQFSRFDSITSKDIENFVVKYINRNRLVQHSITTE